MTSRWLVGLVLGHFSHHTSIRKRIYSFFNVPGQFNEKVVLHQVKYLGLMENLRVRRAGFAYRRPYGQFLQRYKSLCPETWPRYHGNAKDGVQALVCHLGYEKDEYRMGK